MRWFPWRASRHEREAGQAGLRADGGHGAPPGLRALPDEVVQTFIGNLDPAYSTAIRNLGDHLDGKVVADSGGGHSGYVLRFTDGAWVAAWLDPALARMEARSGVGEPPPE